MQPTPPHTPPRRLETLPPPRQHPRSHHPRRPPITKPNLRAHAHDRVTLTRARSAERGIAEREDTTVTGDKPVALPRWRRLHAHHWRVQLQRPRRSLECGVSEAEHAAVRGRQ